MTAGKREFLLRGFSGTSLRNIVKCAGVTTGAFYGYFLSKEDLFDELVLEHYNVLMKRFINAQDNFAALSDEGKVKHMDSAPGEYMEFLVEYIYQNFDAFKLLVCCSEGTKYEGFIHEMVEIEVEATHRFLDVLKSFGKNVKQIDLQLEHILVSGLFSAFFEIVAHDMPKQKAMSYVEELREFFTAGWKKLMGL